RAPPPPADAGALSDAKLRAIYEAYLSAKKRCHEDVSRLTFDSIASKLRQQVPELMKKHNASTVEFKVVVKNGKAVLTAVPKSGSGDSQ
ncbi:MAG TPA: MXAN_5187 C-terminal domain-containing protein, partial [Myxococcaceae bacterium]|nr:MXAN_5187 C-terminal domain-containing protein [Myxococcaceae bacterium]